MSNLNPISQSMADILDAEAEVTAPMLAGVGQVGWMKTWPQLATYSHYAQLKSLVLRGLAAVLKDCNLGAGYDAALDCAKPLIMERLTKPSTDIQNRLLKLVEGEALGPRVELTTERLTQLKVIFKETLLSEDWQAIAKAAAAEVQHQVLDLMVA
ncbi:hypothetical protein Lepto7375DRAFT_7552 [Leptolyngbya sp. PCC 7375]|nr:hypothetical protein Lepto7375DRAFT_7552 [Leptolyngbya sp. PCC 7375]